MKAFTNIYCIERCIYPWKQNDHEMTFNYKFQQNQTRRRSLEKPQIKIRKLVTNGDSLYQNKPSYFLKK